jgi:regulator of replication initiation timing
MESELEVLRQRVTLHEEKIAELKAKSGDLVVENFDLKNEIAKLRQELKSRTKAKKYRA